jgi:hypothetical protein
MPRSQEQKKEDEEEGFLAPFVGCHVAYFFQGAYSKQQAALSSYPHLTLLEVGRSYLESNAHHHRRTYNQCGGYKMHNFLLTCFH